MLSRLSSCLLCAALASAQQVLDVTIFSPTNETSAGQDGKLWLVDFSVSLVSPPQTWPSLALTSPKVNSPVTNNTNFRPGQDVYAPGLVVLCNTTIDKNGTMFSGPLTNLAGLFQLNAISRLSFAGTFQEVWFSWLVGASMFGLRVPSEITIFVMNSSAPAVLASRPSSDVGLLSNIASTPFMIAGNDSVDTKAMSDLTPPVITILAPGPGDLVGLNGSNWIIDLTITDTSSSGRLSTYASGYQDSVTNSFFGPGVNPLAPSLVVTCSTARNTSAFKGPSTNLAKLFQIVSVNSEPGITVVNVVWQVGLPVCGQGINSTIEAYLVDGIAPAYVNSSTTPLSQTKATVDFMLSGSHVDGSSTASSSSGNDMSHTYTNGSSPNSGAISTSTSVTSQAPSVGTSGTSATPSSSSTRSCATSSPLYSTLFIAAWTAVMLKFLWIV